MTVPQSRPSPEQQAIVQRRKKALEILGESLQLDPPMVLAILKNQIMPGASDDEIAAITVICNVYDLNPLLREIYAFPDPKRKRIVPVVGVDGWAKIINRQKDYDGCEFKMEIGADGKTPVSCTCKLYSKSKSHPLEITEYFDECKRNTDPWNNMPKRMLRHKAFIQAGRVAFGISGIYDEDEARDIVVTDAQVTTAPQISAPSFISNPPSLPSPTAQPEQQPDDPTPDPTPAPVQQPAAETEQPKPAAESASPPALPIEDRTAHLDSAGVINLIKDLMKRDNVSEDQVLIHLRTKKIAKPAQKELLELSDTKLRNLVNSWNSELTGIRSITI